jgi:hypothetical protein
VSLGEPHRSRLFRDRKSKKEGAVFIPVLLSLIRVGRRSLPAGIPRQEPWNEAKAERTASKPRRSRQGATVQFARPSIVFMVFFSLVILFCDRHALADVIILTPLDPEKVDFLILVGILLALVFIIGVIGWVKIRKKFAGD